MKTGVIIDCLKKDFEDAASVCAEIGFDGIQLHLSGELSPSKVTLSAVEKRRKTAERYGLEIPSAVGDAGGFGFVSKNDNPEKIKYVEKKIDTAFELGAGVVTAHIGVIPEEPLCEERRAMLYALNVIGEYAEKKGMVYAIETGPEPASRLRGFISSLSSGGIGVNLDPANLVMVTDDDPAEAAKTLSAYIAHTHVKDGKLVKKTDPKVIYDYFAVGGIEDMRLSDYFVETPLGEGGVDFDRYFKALKEIGYDGYLTVERETGRDPEKDIRKAYEFIKSRILG